MANTACQGQDISAPEDWTQAFYPPVAYTSIEGKFLIKRRIQEIRLDVKRLMSKRTPNIQAKGIVRNSLDSPM